MLPKPDRAAIDQWWVTAEPHKELHECEPFRIGNTPGEISVRWTARDVDFYLGSGEHPEPSEEMIEMLAEHLWNSMRPTTGMQWNEKVGEYVVCDYTKKGARREIRGLLAGALGRSCKRRFLVLDAYRMLRSLGRW